MRLSSTNSTDPTCPTAACEGFRTKDACKPIRWPLGTRLGEPGSEPLAAGVSASRGGEAHCDVGEAGEAGEACEEPPESNSRHSIATRGTNGIDDDDAAAAAAVVVVEVVSLTDGMEDFGGAAWVAEEVPSTASSSSTDDDEPELSSPDRCNS